MMTAPVAIENVVSHSRTAGRYQKPCDRRVVSLPVALARLKVDASNFSLPASQYMPSMELHGHKVSNSGPMLSAPIFLKAR